MADTMKYRRQGLRRPIVPAPAYLADASSPYSDPDRIIDTIRQVVIVLDERLRVVIANRAFYRAFDVMPEAVIGQCLAEICDHRLDVPVLRDFLGPFQAEQVAMEDYEIEIELPTLGKRVLLLSAERIRRAPEANCETVVTIDDVTEPKRAETVLKSAKWHAERANLSKSRFLAAASHDLRQQLQAFGMVQEIWAKKITDNKDQEVLQLITRINQTSGALVGVLDGLHELGQLEAGIAQPEMVYFPVNDLLEQLRVEFVDQASVHGFLWHVVPCRLGARSDPRLLKQMIRTLLTSTMKYTERGKVLLGCRHHGNTLRIEVWHTGCEGGLGLAVVNRLAEFLGHALVTRARPGSGSVYAIEVPLEPAQPTAFPRSQQSEARRWTGGTTATNLIQSVLFEPRQTPAQAGSLPLAPSRGDMRESTIFVVDDEGAVREAMRGVLQEEGWPVEVYSSGEAFLEAYRPGRVGCLVVDARMPGMGGVALLEKLKAEGVGPPAIMITGHGDIRLAVRAMKAGAMAFLEKPVRYDELVVNIERALELTRNSLASSSLREEAARRIVALTPRERQVIEMVVEGNPNKQIAYVLGISQRTVETHRATAMKKIGARTISELIHLTISALPHDR